MNTLTKKKTNATYFLQAGLIGAVSTALLNNLYSYVYTAVTGFSIPELIGAGAITMASVITALVAAIAYFVLYRFTSKPTLIFVIMGMGLLLISLGGPLQPQLPDGRPTPDGFAGLALPMHLISGLVLLLLLPVYISKKHQAVSESL